MKKLTLFFLVYVFSNAFDTIYGSVAAKVAEEVLDFISGITAGMAQEKIEQEQLKIEIIKLARENMDMKLNYAIKIKNISLAMLFKEQLILISSMYLAYENEIFELKNNINSYLKKIYKLVRDNVLLFELTSKKNLIILCHYIVEEGFKKFFSQYDFYLQKLSRVKKVSEQKNNEKKEVRISTLQKPEQTLFMYNIAKIIEKLSYVSDEYNQKNDLLNKNFDMTRGPLTEFYFNMINDFKNKIDVFLSKESEKSIIDNNVHWFDLELSITYMESEFLSREELYENVLRDADDVLYDMYATVKKMHIELDWIVSSLQSKLSINENMKFLKSKISELKKKNSAKRPIFIKNVTVKNNNFELLLQKANESAMILLTANEKNMERLKRKKMDSNELLSVFKGCLNAKVILQKTDEYLSVLNEYMINIGKQRDLYINQVRILENIFLYKKELIENSILYGNIDKEKSIIIKKLKEEGFKETTKEKKALKGDGPIKNVLLQGTLDKEKSNSINGDVKSNSSSYGSSVISHAKHINKDGHNVIKGQASHVSGKHEKKKDMLKKHK